MLVYVFLWTSSLVLHLTTVNIFQADAINLKKKNVRDEAEAKIRELGLKSEEIVSEVTIFTDALLNDVHIL